MKKVLVIHGPNLDRLGRREVAVYGTTTLQEIDARLREAAQQLGLELEILQTNHEGAIVDALSRAHGRVAGVLINPGPLTHYSIAVRDGLAAMEVPCVEVHLTNLYRRAAQGEAFRATSVTAPACWGIVSGFGPDSYLLALQALAWRLGAAQPPGKAGEGR